MTDLKTRGEAILGLIAQIRQKQAEQEKSLAQLESWAHLMVQGIDPDRVSKVGWQVRQGKRCDFVVMDDGTKVDVRR